MGAPRHPLNNGRYCVDCVNYVGGTCHRIARDGFDVVMGRPMATKLYFDCYFERDKNTYKLSDAQTIPLCGPSGTFYERRAPAETAP